MASVHYRLKHQIRFVGYHCSWTLQARKALPKQGTAYEWDLGAVCDHRAGDVGQSRSKAPKPYRSSFACPGEANKH